MGYACPVCATPQADDEHLANHLAFTALLGDDDHESWLDEHVPGWEEAGPDELAPDVVEHAEETEYVEVFEDTTGRQRQPGGSADADGEGHEHDHGGESFEDRMARELGADDADEQGGPEGHEHGHDHQHGRGQGHGRPSSPQSGPIDVPGADTLDDEAQDILEEAHELTKEMYGDAVDSPGEDEGENE